MLADLYVADILTNSTTSVYKQQNLWTTNSSILREAGTDHHFSQTCARPPYPTVHQQYFKGQAKEFMQTLIDTISFNTQPDEWQKSALLKTNGDKTRLTVQVLCSKLSSTMNSWSCPANPTNSPTDHPHWPSPTDHLDQTSSRGTEQSRTGEINRKGIVRRDWPQPTPGMMYAMFSSVLRWTSSGVPFICGTWFAMVINGPRVQSRESSRTDRLPWTAIWPWRSQTKTVF